MKKLFAKIQRKIRAYADEHGFTCDVCGAEVFEYPKHRLCKACESTLFWNDKRRCDKCGRKTSADGICLTCKSKPPAFTRGFAPFVYRGDTASYINRIKNGNPRLALFFAERMAEWFIELYPNIENFQNGADTLLVVAVPLTKEKERERGYNQAVEFAERIALTLRKLGYAAETDRELLVKTKETLPQKRMTYRERQENVSGAYRVHKRKACRGRTILLIDDVLTTGATGGECAERLFAAGAKEVCFLVAAAVPEQN